MLDFHTLCNECFLVQPKNVLNVPFEIKRRHDAEGCSQRKTVCFGWKTFTLCQAAHQTHSHDFLVFVSVFFFFVGCSGENNKAAVDTQLQKWKCPWRKPLIIPVHRPVQTGNQSRHAEWSSMKHHYLPLKLISSSVPPWFLPPET